jgi:purine-binding chemotaxis protein CheW
MNQEKAIEKFDAKEKVAQKQAILKTRALALAQESVEKIPDQEETAVVEFLLASEKYGIESSYIREVYPLKELTPLPGTPPFVLGVVSVRGQILSVVDLKKFFDLPDKGLTDLNKIIVLKHNGIEFGVLADVILGLRALRAQDIQPAPPTLTGVREEYLRGITNDRLIVLEAKNILTDEKIKIH